MSGALTSGGNSATSPLDLRLISRRTQRVKELAGFRKSHRVPEQVDEQAERMIGEIASGEISEQLDRMFAQLREAFRFKRKEIEATDPEGGVGSIVTPYFTYSVAITLQEDDPSRVVWHYAVESITEPKQITSEAFETCFEAAFNTVELRASQPIDLEAVIDQVEDQDDPRISLDYDRAITYCNLQIEGLPDIITLTPEAFSLTHPEAQSPKVLLATLRQIQQAALGEVDPRLMAFG
ncbi:MAG: hypothetical protein WDZ51_02865 [Pirellulaceae bacterium]